MMTENDALPNPELDLASMQATPPGSLPPATATTSAMPYPTVATAFPPAPLAALATGWHPVAQPGDDDLHMRMGLGE